MKAFHGDQAIKEKYISRVRAHREADNLIRGEGWDGYRGCAVGCTLEAYDHKRYESELGIPEWLARVEDVLFEGMPKDDAMLWPERFLSAIKPGVDLEKIKVPFLIFVLKSALEKFDHEEFPDCKTTIEAVIKLYESGETDLEKFRCAADAADAAARAAYAAADAAYDAAYAAAGAVYDVADVASATYDAAEAVYAIAGTEAEHKKFAEKLIELIEACE